MKKITALLLALALTLGMTAGAAEERSPVAQRLDSAAARVLATTPNPGVGSAGGEWAVLGLVRGGANVPAGYYDSYYAALETTVREKEGVLHARKYTEYARTALTLTAIGKDPRNVAGYDLLLPLGDYEKTAWQGINGPIWALIALDAGNYAIPQNSGAKTQATREAYLTYLLEKRLPDGGWALAGEEKSDPDVTGMALQALAPYAGKAEVAAAIDGALSCMSAQQTADGGFSSWGDTTVESCAQMVVALCTLGIAMDDPRFVKGENTLLDALLRFSAPEGGFLHTLAGKEDVMGTEQGLYALAALKRAEAGESPLYRMTAHADVGKTTPATQRVFPDMNGHPAREAAEALATREIVTGKPDGSFDPDSPMTRAEFSTVAVKALGLTGAVTDAFSDVAAGDWYAAAVGGAYTYGIVKGSAGRFMPTATITRQEAAVMLQNAATLCGLNTAMGGEAGALAAFTDGAAVAPWAASAVTYCYGAGILPGGDGAIRPQEPILRGEIAHAFYRLLTIAKLL